MFAGELCLDFINTLDNRPVPERRLELLPSYRELAEWAAQAGAIRPAQHAALISEADSHPRDAAAVRARAIALRECLYRMVTALVRNRLASKDELEDDLRTFSAYLGEAFSHLELRPARKELRLEWPEETSQLDSILWPIVRSASELLTGNDLKYVRECGMETCRWVFVDRSKNHSRRWCDMTTCGNRAKARKFYRRRGGTRARSASAGATTKAK